MDELCNRCTYTISANAVFSPMQSLQSLAPSSRGCPLVEIILYWMGKCNHFGGITLGLD